MKNQSLNSSHGFTLVELLVSIVLSGIAMAAMYNVFGAYNKSYVREDAAVNTMQDLRAAMGLMTRDIRMSGLNYNTTSGIVVGITDISRFNGASRITFKMDYDENGYAEDYEYGLYDSGPDGDLDLYRIAIIPSASDLNPPSVKRAVIDNVEHLEMAFAVDDDNKDDDRDPLHDINNNVLWMVSSSGDNDLDRFIDTDENGVIDESDTPGGAPAGGIVLANTGLVRAIKIWMLVRIDRKEADSSDDKTYVMADKRYSAAAGDFDPTFKRRLLVKTVRLWNEGLNKE